MRRTLSPPPSRRARCSQFVVSLLVYIAFVFFTIFSAQNLMFSILMMVTGTLNILLEMSNVVDRKLGKAGPEAEQKLGSPLMLELLVVLRVLKTSLVPMVLASFGGASFFAVAQMGAVAEACSVAQLAALAQEGYTSYACRDGYIPVDVQLGVPAWKERSMEGRRLGEGETVGAADENHGFVAPIYTSHSDYLAGEAPVAWAVKAGSPVRPSICNHGNGGTCGIFVSELRASMGAIPAPPNFGEAWGFNVTHFSRAEMDGAVEAVRARHPELSLGSGPATYVIAEGTQQYFGIAYPLFWVTGTLLAVGLVDRLPPLFEAAEAEDDKPPGPLYKEMTMQRNVGVAAPTDVASRGIFEEANAFWNDALNSRKLHALTESLDQLPEAPRGMIEDAQTSPRRTAVPPPVAGIRGNGLQQFQPSSARYSALGQANPQY